MQTLFSPSIIRLFSLLSLSTLNHYSSADAFVPSVNNNKDSRITESWTNARSDDHCLKNIKKQSALRNRMLIPRYNYQDSQTSIKSTLDQFHTPKSNAFSAFFQPRVGNTQKDDTALTVSSSSIATQSTTQPSLSRTASKNDSKSSSTKPTWHSLIMGYRTLKRSNQQEITLVDIDWLKTHEEIISDRVHNLKNAIKEWNEYRMPLLVDCKSGAILDGHHRYHVGRELGLTRLPVILVDYLEDDTIDVDVWPECGIDCLSKEDVIKMSLSDKVFPPKTSKHGFVAEINPISIPLSHLA